MTWNPDQYLKFAEPRLRPAVDLLARIPLASPTRVFDLGCGAGNVTRLLLDRWPRADIAGVDDSPEMLARARESLPALHWIQSSIADWQVPQAADLIYSNATLHWLPDHGRLLPGLLSMVAPGGILAIQMPRNFAAPSHTTIADTVRAGPWRQKLESLLKPPPVLEPADYYAMLGANATRIDIWETEYLQVLEGEDPVKEWVKGTWLKQFLAALDNEEAQAFEQDYADRVRLAYPRLKNGRTLFPFRRLFIIAQR